MWARTCAWTWIETDTVCKRTAGRPSNFVICRGIWLGSTGVRDSETPRTTVTWDGTQLVSTLRRLWTSLRGSFPARRSLDLSIIFIDFNIFVHAISIDYKNVNASHNVYLCCESHKREDGQCLKRGQGMCAQLAIYHGPQNNNTIIWMPMTIKTRVNVYIHYNNSWLNQYMTRYYGVMTSTSSPVVSLSLPLPPSHLNVRYNLSNL